MATYLETKMKFQHQEALSGSDCDGSRDISYRKAS